MTLKTPLRAVLVVLQGVALAVLLAPAATRAAPPDRPALDGAGLRTALDAIPAAGAPGAFAEVRAGHRTWRGAAGVADLATGAPMRPGLRHRIGSVTKTFVATAVLQLVAEGRLRLDDPVARWLRLPGLDPRVTVRMLLRQTSGIADYAPVILGTVEAVEANRVYRPERLARIGLARPRVGEPGGAHSYSNTNYVLAGLLLERVTGRPAAAEITRRILRPLGLRDTYFPPGTEPRIRGPHAHGYVPWTDGLRDFDRYRFSWAWMAGDLVSTTADVNRFFRALFGGSGSGAVQSLLPPSLLAEMRETVPMPPADPASAGYGLGVFWVATPCGPVWGHDGIALGYQTLSLHSADGRRQATVALNLTHYQENPDQAHPIDVAVARFALTALCGEAPEQGSSGSGGAELVTLGILHDPPVSRRTLVHLADGGGAQAFQPGLELVQAVRFAMDVDVQAVLDRPALWYVLEEQPAAVADAARGVVRIVGMSDRGVTAEDLAPAVLGDRVLADLAGDE
jgi:D-alanyl-D-alanine carboxypeptidase